jgi:hypothetical protein
MNPEALKINKMKTYHVTIITNQMQTVEFSVTAKNLVEAKKLASKNKRHMNIKGSVSNVFCVIP